MQMWLQMVIDMLLPGVNPAFARLIAYDTCSGTYLFSIIPLKKKFRMFTCGIFAESALVNQ